MTTTNGDRGIFLDTNILVRANVISAPLHDAALTAIQTLRRSNTALWLSRQVLREYIATVTRPQNFMQPMDAATVVKRVEYFETRFTIADETSIVTRNLLNLIASVAIGGKQVHDANIVATMQAYNIRRLLTLNTADFARFTPSITLLTLEDVLKQAEDSDEQS